MIRTTFLTGAALLCAFALTFKAIPANAAGLDLSPNSTVVENIAAQGSGSGSSPPAANPANPATLAPLSKFSAMGRLTESLATGGCPNDPLTVSCGSSCSALTFSGPVTGSMGTAPLGKANLEVCLTLEPSSSLGSCLGNGLGLGTLTLANGNVMDLSVSGNFCINDETLSSPITIDTGTNLIYVVEGGTGKFAMETGTGNVAVSSVFVNPGSSPIPATGEISLTGVVSKN